MHRWRYCRTLSLTSSSSVLTPSCLDSSIRAAMWTKPSKALMKGQREKSPQTSAREVHVCLSCVEALSVLPACELKRRKNNPAVGLNQLLWIPSGREGGGGDLIFSVSMPSYILLANPISCQSYQVIPESFFEGSKVLLHGPHHQKQPCYFFFFQNICAGHEQWLKSDSCSTQKKNATFLL